MDEHELNCVINRTAQMKASDWLSAVMKQYIMTYNYISFKTRFTILTVTNELETRL